MPIHRAEITGYLGPMFASKTQRLLNLIGGHEACGRTVLVVKPSIDDRYDMTEIRSRSGGNHAAISIPISNPDEIVRHIIQKGHLPDLVAIDELQFFDPRINGTILTLAHSGVEVAYSSLIRDYRGEPFPATKEVMPLSTHLELIEARCMYTNNGDKHLCGRHAQHTQRLFNNQPDSYNSPTVVIEKPGQSWTYQARCHEHWQVPDTPTRRIIIPRH
jgi:thymidine kinase